MVEHFIEKATERTQIMATTIFAFWYEQKLATNPTNSNELTSQEFVLVRTSSLLYSCSFMGRRFITDFAVRFLYYSNKSEIFNLSGEMFHLKENQPQSPQRAQSVDIILCVLSDLCGFSNKKTNQSPTTQRKPTQKESITCN